MKKIATLLLILYLGIWQITSVYAQNFPGPVYAAPSVVVIDASTGLVLYETNARKARYPASITKIMTALIVLDHTTNFDERVTFSDRAIFSTPRYSSHIAMDVGETLTVYEALYALMLSSANEVSLALAEHVAGSIEEFVDLMNRRARGLGAYDTYFVNPSGLPGDGHVTTAFDMALIMQEAVRHPLFVDIIGTRRFDIPPTERQPEVRALRNTNRLIHEGPDFNGTVVGSKTGWTNNAGHTLVTYAVQDGRRLIVSVLGSDTPDTFVDTTALLDYGFGLQYAPVRIFDAAAHVPTVPVFETIDGRRTETGRVPLQAAEDVYFDLPQGFDTGHLRYEFSLPQGLAPPVEAGTVQGSVSIYVQNYRVGSALLRAGAYVPGETADEPPMYDGAAYENAALYPGDETVNETANEAVNETANETVSYAPDSSLYFEAEDMLFTLVVPIVVSAVTLVLSLAVHFIKRNKRLRGKMHERYARYPEYRYK